jgi:hypothetical protein
MRRISFLARIELRGLTNFALVPVPQNYAGQQGPDFEH